MGKIFYVYIMSSKTGTIYTGMTSNLERRVYEHKSKLVDGFTKKYDVIRLVYYEEIATAEEAINREKQIKSWRRRKKTDLIKGFNPTWNDIAEDWYDI